MKTQNKNSKLIIPKRILPLILLIEMIASCEMTSSAADDSDTSSSSSTTSTIDTSEYSESVATSSSSTYNSADVLAKRTFSGIIYIDLDTLEAGTDTSYGSDFSDSSVAFSSYGVTISGEDTDEICIDSDGYSMKFVITGSTNCTLYFESSDDFQLYLDDVEIETEDGPALIIDSDVRTFITSADNSANTLSDASDRDEISGKGALCSEGTLIFGGEGKLTVNGSYKHGILCDQYIRVTEGTLNVNVSERDAIRSTDGFIFDDGALTISATGTTQDDESKGIKVKGDESSEGAGLGYIVINGGTIDITSVSKGMTASWDEDDDAEDSDSSNDPDADVIINNGVITVTTTGTVYENSDGTSCSPEGIEGKDDLEINKAYMVINAADDCLNAGNSITIAGGYIYCNSSDNDAIDSNGTLSISSGVIVAIGADGCEDGFDCDDNDFEISGGTFIGIGGGTSTPTSSENQAALMVNNSRYDINSGSYISVLDSDEDCVFAFELPDSADTILLSSSGVTTGSSYTLYSGGDASSDSLFYGLCLDDIYYISGTKETDFTINSDVYSLGGTVTAFH